MLLRIIKKLGRIMLAMGICTKTQRLSKLLLQYVKVAISTHFEIDLVNLK